MGGGKIIPPPFGQVNRSDNEKGNVFLFVIIVALALELNSLSLNKRNSDNNEFIGHMTDFH